MNVINSVKDYVTNVFDFNQATVSGAIDIVAVQHEDGTYRCTPFHVHFGRLELKSNAEKVVTIRVNGEDIHGVHMKLGAAGEAFFVDSVEDPVEDDYSTSPLVSPTSSIGATTSRTRSCSQPIGVPGAELTRDHLNATTEAEWHDAYRVVTERPFLRRENSTSSERLTWGWGALPTVRTMPVFETSVFSEDLQADDEQPKMTKNDSVYFDAIETDSVHSNAYFSDLPCMSLCGNLLEHTESREEAHAIFSEHIIPYEIFRENAADLLKNPSLRFLVDGKICPFNTEIQAFLVARVLFPSSQPLAVSCGWTARVRQRRVSERAESAYWFGGFEDDEEDEQELEPLEQPHQGRRWFHWFPRPSSVDDRTETSSLRSISTASSSTKPSKVTFFRKSLGPSQEELRKMRLRYGTNEVEFSVHTSNGVDRVYAKLFLWPVSTKIIIAEIDGAISRPPTSRRLSALLPIMERESASHHHGALDFYARVAKNGYKVVYLTSRGISQAELIHDMLQQSDNTTTALPNGPVLLSPDRLLESDPEEATVSRDFKITALSGLRSLFPQDVNPFYAAFGKTLQDSAVFTQVGVFPGKVFLVDEGDGRLRHRSMINFQESYSSMMDMVDKMFPPICSPSARSSLRRRNNMPDNNYEQPPSPLPCTMSSSSKPTLKRVQSNTEEIVSDVLSFHVRTRSLGDEAYNDVNFWRIKPGSI